MFLKRPYTGLTHANCLPFSCCLPFRPMSVCAHRYGHNVERAALHIITEERQAADARSVAVASLHEMLPALSGARNCEMLLGAAEWDQNVAVTKAATQFPVVRSHLLQLVVREVGCDERTATTILAATGWNPMEALQEFKKLLQECMHKTGCDERAARTFLATTFLNPMEALQEFKKLQQEGAARRNIQEGTSSSRDQSSCPDQCSYCDQSHHPYLSSSRDRSSRRDQSLHRDRSQ